MRQCDLAQAEAGFRQHPLQHGLPAIITQYDSNSEGAISCDGSNLTVSMELELRLRLDVEEMNGLLFISDDHIFIFIWSHEHEVSPVSNSWSPTELGPLAHQPPTLILLSTYAVAVSH